jgi:hypothetical protein
VESALERRSAERAYLFLAEVEVTPVMILHDEAAVENNSRRPPAQEQAPSRLRLGCVSMSFHAASCNPLRRNYAALQATLTTSGSFDPRQLAEFVGRCEILERKSRKGLDLQRGLPRHRQAPQTRGDLSRTHC